jgi:hypothetical protein
MHKHIGVYTYDISNISKGRKIYIKKERRDHNKLRKGIQQNLV